MSVQQVMITVGLGDFAHGQSSPALQPPDRPSPSRAAHSPTVTVTPFAVLQLRRCRRYTLHSQSPLHHPPSVTVSTSSTSHTMLLRLHPLRFPPRHHSNSIFHPFPSSLLSAIIPLCVLSSTHDCASTISSLQVSPFIEIPENPTRSRVRSWQQSDRKGRPEDPKDG